MMSQQSTMPTVVKYFQSWMKHFPSLSVLARAEPEEVLRQWQGLGYYSRARNVHKAAQQLLVFKKSHRRWPNTVEEWLALPGVGQYTAKAIVAVCFDGIHLPVDGNVIRVFARVCGIKDPLNNKKDMEGVTTEIERIEFLLIERGADFSLFAQAFMELGSQVCRPKALAACNLCPLRRVCVAHAKGVQPGIPAKKELKKSEKIESLALLFRQESSFLLRQIPEGNRLAGQWELPQLHLRQESPSIKEIISAFYEISGESSHSITHHRYKAFLVEAGRWRGAIPRGHILVDIRNWRGFPGTLSTLTRKLLFLVEKHRC